MIMNHRDLIDRINATDVEPDAHTEIPPCKNWNEWARLNGDKRFELRVSITRLINYLKRRK